MNEGMVTSIAKDSDTYRQLLDRCRRQGDVLEEAVGQERRIHPRLRVHPDRLPQPLSPWRLAIDISATGIAFYTDEPPDFTSPVTVALGELQQAEAHVLEYQEMPLTLLHDPPRYRVRCQFADEDAGLRMLFAIKEMEGTRPAVS